VAHICNPSFLGGWDWEDHYLTPAQVEFSRPHLKNNQNKVDWRPDSNSRAATLQVQSPEFKPQYHLKKKIFKILKGILQ
jgi:hypothetical protein